MTARFEALVLIAAVASAACGGSGHGDRGRGMVTGPNGVGDPQDYGAAFVSVVPAGGSTGVPTSTSITLRFGTAMAAGMEHYVDLHVGDVAGPTLSLACHWSSDRTTLTCAPSATLRSRTTYVLHLGGGMTTQAGAPIDYAHYGPMMGGHWIMGGMMGPNHGGHAWGRMEPGWHHPNGSYGLAFSFTTA
jgi:hypothetical protein